MCTLIGRFRGMQREKMIILARKYVLGHLSEQDAVEAERGMQSDPEFRRIVSRWRGSSCVAKPIEPSSGVWRRIVS